MSILRYTASLDNTITNAFEENLTTRGTGSNMGASDILEVFSIYGQAASSSSELSRVLIQFPLSQATSDRNAGLLPASGSVTLKLKLYNAPHYTTTPRSYDLKVSAVSASWEEGTGLDMEDYSDLTKDGIGSNWINAASGTAWTTAGGDYHANSSSVQSFDSGLENLDIDVSGIVEKWLTGSNSWDNYGFGIQLTNAYETAETSYYTKKFFGRGTEFFFKRPVLEAQFNDSTKDDRGNFYISSSLLPAADNLNTLYFYNKFRGRLVDIAGDSTKLPVLKLYYSSGSVPEGNPRGFQDQTGSATTFLTASRVSTGTYKAQVAVTSSIITNNYPYLMDVWSYGGQEVLTGSVIIPTTFRPETYEDTANFVLNMTNLKSEYGRNDLAKLRLYVREKNWSPNIYTVAKSTPENKTIISGSYKVIRIADELTVVDYGTGSVKYTELSYDQNGNYFEFNMNMLEPGYQYGFKFSFYDEYTLSYLEQPYLFKFRVV